MNARLPSRQIERVQHPFVRIPFRDDVGHVELFDVWREDHLDPDPNGDQVYLVLDMHEETRLEPLRHDEAPNYVSTGKLVLELQAVDRHTGEGLALPHERSVSPIIPERPTPIEELGQVIAHEWSTKPLTGLTLIPRSPRRPDASRD